MHELATWLTASLLAASIAARVAILWGERLPGSPFAPFAFVWQDVAIALGFLAVAYVAGRAAGRFQPVIVLPAYVALILLVAAGVPIGRELSAQFPAAMAGTPSGALLDYATPANIALIALVLTLGFAPPYLAARLARRSAEPEQDLPVRESVRGGTILIPKRTHVYGGEEAARRARARRRALNVAAIIALLAVAGTGIVAARLVDTKGLDRNAFIAFVRSGTPQAR